MDQRPNPQCTTHRHQPALELQQALHCPLCRRLIAKSTIDRAAVEVVCDACGFAFELPAAGPPGQKPAAEQVVGHENPLDCWLAGDPIRPREVSDWERLRQWAGHRPVLARVIAFSGLAILLTAAVSTLLLVGSSVVQRQTQRALALLQQAHAATSHRLQEAEGLVRQRERESHRAVESCQATLRKLEESEGQLEDLRRRYGVLAQGREAIESTARLDLARRMAAESSRRLTAQPAESLLLAERAITYLSEQGEPVPPELQQTLRDAVALTGDLAFRGHSGPVEAIAVSRNGRWLLTGSSDMTARLWDLHGPEPEENSQVLAGHQSQVRLVKISPDSRWAITAADQGQVILWDLKSANPAASMVELPAQHGRIYDLAISSDSRWLAVSGSGSFEEEDNGVRLWDLKNFGGTEDSPSAVVGAEGGSVAGQGRQPQVLRGHVSPVLAVAITPDCRWVVTGGEDETVRLFDLTSKYPAASQVVLRQHAGPITSIAISSDGRWMVTGSQDRTARLWDLTTPQPGARSTVLYGHEAWIHSVAVSRTGRWVATAAQDHTARLWDMNAVDPAGSCVVLSGQQMDVGPILFSPDGQQLITGSDDGTVRVWDVESPDPAAHPVVLRGHCGPIAALAVTPDGRTILTGCRETVDRTDCLVRMWDVSAEKVLEKARPIIAERLNSSEQEHVLLETARRVRGEGAQPSELQ